MNLESFGKKKIHFVLYLLCFSDIYLEIIVDHWYSCVLYNVFEGVLAVQKQWNTEYIYTAFYLNEEDNVALSQMFV